VDRANQLANHYGLPVVVSSALESVVGINYGLQLAGSISNLQFDCGLATGALLAKDLGKLPIINGEITITNVEPDLSGLEVSPDRYKWWKNRVLETAEKIK
jgi:O-succinylbenzoate synthase